MTARVRIAALVLGAALVAACGGTSAPSHDEYVGVANQSCDASEAALDKIETANEKEPDTVRPDRWIRARVVPAFADLSAQLRGLTPPEGDAGYLGGLYNELDGRIRVLKAKPSLGIDGVWTPSLKRRFANYGMDRCGVDEPAN